MTEENIKYTKIQKLSLEIAANVFHPHAIARIQSCVDKSHEDFYKIWWKNFPKKRSELVAVLEQCSEEELKEIREALYNADYPNSFPENTNDSEAWTAISANYMEYSLCFPKK
jgi:hypothetical protein